MIWAFCSIWRPFNPSAIAIDAGNGFVIDIFGGDIHKGEIKGLFFGENVFGGDGVDVAADVAEEGAAGFLPGVVVFGVEDILKVVEGELGVDGDRALGEDDQGVHHGSGFEAVLEVVMLPGQDFSEEIVQGPFPKGAAQLGRLEDVLEFFDVGADLEDVLGGLG